MLLTPYDLQVLMSQERTTSAAEGSRNVGILESINDSALNKLLDALNPCKGKNGLCMEFDFNYSVEKISVGSILLKKRRFLIVTHFFLIWKESRLLIDIPFTHYVALLADNLLFVDIRCLQKQTCIDLYITMPSMQCFSQYVLLMLSVCVPPHTHGFFMHILL